MLRTMMQQVQQANDTFATLLQNAPPPPPSELPTPASGGGNRSNTKRQRDEESTSPSFGSLLGESPAASGSGAVANEPSPHKRPKMEEWDAAPSDALKKKTDAVESVKTEEDATAFLEQMTELIMAARGEGQESLMSDISETLDMILKGYADGADGSRGLPSLGMESDNDMVQTAPANPPIDDFVEFFDFSLSGALDDDDTGSNAHTPDLLSSSSTDPSPELSAPHSDDVLDAWLLKEIDEGESAGQPSDWKWDGPMFALDRPWAGFSS